MLPPCPLPSLLISATVWCNAAIVWASVPCARHKCGRCARDSDRLLCIQLRPSQLSGFDWRYLIRSPVLTGVLAQCMWVRVAGASARSLVCFGRTAAAGCLSCYVCVCCCGRVLLFGHPRRLAAGVHGVSRLSKFSPVGVPPSEVVVALVVLSFYNLPFTIYKCQM